MPCATGIASVTSAASHSSSRTPRDGGRSAAHSAHSAHAPKHAQRSAATESSPSTGASCAATKLADFKVPRKILFLAEIPKGATGKLMRIGLAAKLGLGEG